MVAGNKTIVDYIDNCASGSPTDQELAQLAGAIQGIENGDVGYSVACSALLPNAADNTGRLVFVEDIGAYRYSNGIEWTNDYTSSLATLKSELYVWGGCCCFQDYGMILLGSGVAGRRVFTPTQEITSAADWKLVSGADKESKGIKLDGTLWTWGCSTNGSAGTNVFSCTYFSPVQEVSSSTNWSTMSRSVGLNTLAIKTDGTMWGWGRNNYGQLATNDTWDYCSPVREITSSSNWCSVIIGPASFNCNLHAHAIKTDGTLWSWGWDLGNGFPNETASLQYSSPIREITSSTNWCKVDDRVAIKSDGTLWSWGCGGTGRLAVYTTANASSPVQELTSSTNWVCASKNGYVTLAIKDDGTMWGWGDNSNSYGSIGTPLKIGYSSPIQEVSSSTTWETTAVGLLHAAMKKTDGTIWGTGWNRDGQLGRGNTVCASSPVQEISSRTTWCYVSTGFNYTFGILATPKGFNEP